MPLREQVIDAFNTLNINPDVQYSDALKAYKRLALLHHPDRNHGDSSSTERFQKVFSFLFYLFYFHFSQLSPQIGAAWNICQRHFDNPAWSHVPAGPTYQYYDDDEDDDDDDDYYFMDKEDLHAYYMFMFAETLANRFSRASGKHYRHQRSRGPGAYSFHHEFSEYSQQSQAALQERQRREKEEYEKRKRELELEIEEEERQKQQAAKAAQADQDRKASIVDHIYQLAYAGDSPAVREAILEHDLDVNTPRKRAKHTRKQDPLRGASADTKLLNKQDLTPFHAAIKAGNTRVVRFIMDRRGRSFEGYHPSKAAPSGRTPLQLAIDSHQPAMIELLVREATTHDVERCWKQEGLSEEIKNILRTKKGFVPPEQVHNKDIAPNPSKKGSRKQELAQQKAAQLALEQERAKAKREKREEREAQRAKEIEQERLRLEEEECRRRENEEALRRETEAEQERLEKERIEKERIRIAEAERQKLPDRLKAEQEEKLRRASEEAERQAKKQEMMRHKLEEQRPGAGGSKQPPPSKPSVQERELPSEQALSQSAPLSSPPMTPNSSTAPPSRQVRRHGLTDEERRTIKRDKQRERRRSKAAMRAQSSLELPQPVREANKPKAPRAAKVTTHLRINKKPDDMTVEEREEYQKVLRRRAEQSARDKERAQSLKEKRPQLKTPASPPGYTPLTPVSTHTYSRRQTPMHGTSSSEVGYVNCVEKLLQDD
ncbi:hypothetical protein CVT24_005749 [Panaeolus cyanescens]|uniref:J domain-containing protein n=1 Tax=Panaeolus cyanescens TaxID=181874 RepID=A0A409V967_9AGAR|nr:hypothetical protein CVT24_005749 [Panaeolus cyanescens]